MESRLTLSELQLIIRDALYLSLPDFFWVAAEISEIKENSAGHCYLELIEKNTGEENPRAKIKAIIWGSRAGFIKSFFRSSTGEDLGAGMKILVKAKIEYHELYGLSLIISDIDPSYTIGEMALKRQIIIRQLEKEGVLDMNRELPFPFVPQRIAVISSAGAAGYSDFTKHLSGNAFGYVFYHALFEAVMQGAETEKSIIAALDRVAEHMGVFDVVVIIRGGGSQSDLSWFDNYNIAYHVTQFPLPVLTGIGHEKDLSVTDMVAYEALKTPTAVADYLISATADAERHIMEISNEINDLAGKLVRNYHDILESARLKLVPSARLMVAGGKELLSSRIIELANTGKGYILKAGMIPAGQNYRLSAAANRLCTGKISYLDGISRDLVSQVRTTLANSKTRTESLEKSLKILDPVNVLSRGYTITSKGGKVLKSVTDTAEDEVIDTHFSDGNIKSKVI